MFLFEQSGPTGISRIHFHSFGYHIIAIRTNKAASAAASNSNFLWTNSKQALAGGSLIASTTACGKSVEQLHGNDLDIKITHVAVNETDTLKISTQEPVLVWYSKDITGSNTILSVSDSSAHMFPNICMQIPNTLIVLSTVCSCGDVMMCC